MLYFLFTPHNFFLSQVLLLVLAMTFQWTCKAMIYMETVNVATWQDQKVTDADL